MVGVYYSSNQCDTHYDVESLREKIINRLMSVHTRLGAETFPETQVVLLNTAKP